MNQNQTKLTRGRLPNQCIDYLRNVEGLNKKELKAEFKSFFGRELTDNTIIKYCANRIAQIDKKESSQMTFTWDYVRKGNAYVEDNVLVIDNDENNQSIRVCCDLFTAEVITLITDSKISKLKEEIEKLQKLKSVL